MKIAVLSGKGGTGKTFLSVNLACTEGDYGQLNELTEFHGGFHGRGVK